MQISNAIEQLLATGTRMELVDAVTASASEVAACDGVRVAELKKGSSVAYRAMARFGPAPDPSPSIARSPLSSPLVAEHVRSGFQEWVSMQDLLPGRLWTTHPLYLEVYRPLGLSAQISCALRVTGKVTYSLSLNRAGRDFDEREREQLEQYRRLVHTAWLRVEELEAIRSVLASLHEEREDDAVVVLTPDPLTPHIAYCTEGMRRLLLEHGELRELIQQMAGSAEHVASRALTSASSTLRLIAVHTGDAVVIQAVPASLEQLSDRERQVLSLLERGLTVAAAAHRLAISPSTARKHVESIHRKLGTTDLIGTLHAAKRLQ